jgi:hypothetical protein
MDFYRVGEKETKGGIEIFPDFTVGRSKDLMVRARSFYAVWDDEAGLWSTDEYDVQRLVDAELEQYASEARARGTACHVRSLGSFNAGMWSQFRKYLQQVSDNAKQLDASLTFANTPVKKTDYVSRRLPYDLAPGDYSAWDELVGTLYSVEERAKIEWAIGSIVDGSSKRIQKFLVLYGPAGTGKSTILNIVQKLFEGYVTTFEAKALGSNNGSFATEAFRDNPLVAIQHDGDLSKIEDNTRLNSIVAHEDMTINEKYKPGYTARVNAFLFMGTNQPVKISDAKSGIIRRLIDVHPTGVKIPNNHYNTLMARIDFELGAIAHHCLDVFRTMGRNYYNTYRPVEMMFQTDIFFNFVEAHYDIFKSQAYMTLKQAYALYKEFCNDTGIERPLPQYKVREELRNYFDKFQDRHVVGDDILRSVYIGFNANHFKAPAEEDQAFSLVIDETESLLDEVLASQPAQYANPDGNPIKKWHNVDTTLASLDTRKLHFVKVPETHIVIDFDLKDEDGRKSLERNLAAASSWPATYAELSKSGAGVHLHYNYTGSGELASNYSDGIEVKVFRGNASLRRMLSRCNAVPIADINTGLPLKEKKVLQASTMGSEKGLRELIARNLKKEIHPGTKPSVDFIKKVLDDAYQSGMPYDVTDLRSRIIAFANNSTHQPFLCLKTVQQMKFKSDVTAEQVSNGVDDRLVIFDVEVFPNLFVICWKFEGAPSVVRMVNPSASEVEKLFNFRLVGYNNRRYDNHILYGAYMGYTNDQLYALSQKLTNNVAGACFGEAYNLSYADIYDFSSKKQSLKKFEIELGLKHMELGLPWDQPVPKDLWNKVVEYCVNDVEAQEAVLEARRQDFVARQILADLSGLSVNDTTQKHTARIIFGSDRDASSRFIYTDLALEFPGYTYDRGRSSYREEVVGEGGYVYAEPGIYENVALLDVASMHPTSIERLNLFGEYTRNFSDLKNARLAIKHRDFKTAKTLLGGKLAKFLGDSESDADSLSYALKIVINIVYGLTSAKFDNPFRDVRNKDNIVAKRGALFMIDLKHALQERGLTVAHIKTDSVKIPNATDDDIQFVMDFGERYGYTFEHEATYERFCLVNDAVYVARKGDQWVTVGAQFAHPYVFKTLFSGEDVNLEDFYETRQVTQGAMYLDFSAANRPMFMPEELHFVGKIGQFIPVTEESGIGGVLVRVKDDKSYAVGGTKGYLWVEANVAEALNVNPEIDLRYFEDLANRAQKAIEQYGDFHAFVN